jgi:hypothetical protein
VTTPRVGGRANAGRSASAFRLDTSLPLTAPVGLMPLARREQPGRSVREFRIFVDGELAGRGGQCGCSLGFGGGDLPAVACVDSDLVVTVDAVAGEQLPVVELWRIRQAHGEQ